MREVFDFIRQIWVAATPEEVVRQQWIQQMTQSLHFPKELLVVEKELKILPHLIHFRKELPSRRIDLLSFMKVKDEVKPLLLIECKKSLLNQLAMDQAISYNHYVKAPYIAIANESSIRFRYHFLAHPCEIEYLPSYRELVEVLSG